MSTSAKIRVGDVVALRVCERESGRAVVQVCQVLSRHFHRIKVFEGWFTPEDIARHAWRRRSVLFYAGTVMKDFLKQGDGYVVANEEVTGVEAWRFEYEPMYVNLAAIGHHVREGRSPEED